MLQWFFPLRHDERSTGVGLAQLTSEIALIMVDGLSLSPVGRILIVAAMVCLRPLLYDFFDRLLVADSIGAPVALAAPPDITPLVSTGDRSETISAVAATSRVTSRTSASVETEARRGQIGLCEVY